MSIEVEESQSSFLRDGGTYRLGLAYHRKNGTLPRSYTYHEYPKMIRLSDGTREVECSTMTCDKQILKWTETQQVYRDILVHDEAEEERILSGGKTSAQIEEDRQTLIGRCSAAGIRVDPTWSAVRLRRELGEKMDAPEAPDRMAALKEEFARLSEMAALEEKIAGLKAQLAGKPADSDDPDTLRAQLRDLGIEPDGRWKAPRLREELDKATAPSSAA